MTPLDELHRDLLLAERDLEQALLDDDPEMVRNYESDISAIRSEIARWGGA